MSLNALTLARSPPPPLRELYLQELHVGAEVVYLQGLRPSHLWLSDNRARTSVGESWRWRPRKGGGTEPLC